jgi:hypothetical protein
MSCCRGAGRLVRRRPPLKRRNHARQQSSFRHHDRSRRKGSFEDEDWLSDVANGMDPEDGVIWVYGVGEDSVMAFTDFGIETLMELIRMYKENPGLLRR